MFDGWYDISKRSKNWHKAAIPTTQMDWEITELVKIFDDLNPKRVLEIGSEKGGTLWYWMTALDAGSKIVNIDILQNQTPEVAAALPGEWASWAPVGVEYHPVIGRSDDPQVYKKAMEYLGGEIDFLFIDGLHSYEGAKSDFLAYGQHVRKGGIIALHDLLTPEAQPWIEVGQLWDEIRAAGYLVRELKCGYHKCGIGVVYI